MVSILLVFYVGLFYVNTFLLPQDWTSLSHGISFDWLSQWSDANPIGAKIVAIVLLVLEGFYLNMIVMNHRLSTKTNLFPGVFYVLIMCMSTSFLDLTPQLVANLFLIIAVGEALNAHKKILRVSGHIYNIGFWISVSALFCSPYLIALVWGFLALSILRGLKAKEFLMVFVGALTPLYLAAIYYYFTDRLPYYYKTQFVDGLGFFHVNLLQSDFYDYVSWGLLGLLFLLVLINGRQYKLKKIMDVRKKIEAINWLVFIVPFSLLIQYNNFPNQLQILAVPMGILLGFQFTKMKDFSTSLLHALIVLIVLFLQYHDQILGLFP